MKEVKSEDIQVLVADESHEVYVDTIIDTIREAARKRGTGIAERTHEYVATKMKEGKAVLALHGDKFVGFSYIETWGNKQYVTTSGLIVHPDYQGQGLGRTLMNDAMAYIKSLVKPGYKVMVSLMAAQGKEDFYKKFGFITRPDETHGSGMCQWIQAE